MLKKYFDYIGLCKNVYVRKCEVYTPATEIKIAREYLAYLQGVNATRDARQITIETKTSQIIGQTSIVISIVSLFVPLFADKFNDLDHSIKWTLLVVFTVLIFHFILATLHALKNLQIEKSRYMEGSTTTVTKETRAKTELEFINVQIKDLVNIINYNNPLTNRAAAGLVYASRCFKIGTGTFFIFILGLLVCFTSMTKTAESIRIENIKELKDETSKQLPKMQIEINTLKTRLDSLQSLKLHKEMDATKAKVDTANPLQKKSRIIR
jgi:hypothetical protein